MHQGLVVGEEGEIMTFQEETEMAAEGIGCQDFFVKDGVFGFGRGKFLGEKGKRGPETTETLLKNSTNMRVGRINSQTDGSTEFRVSKDRDRGEEELGIAEGGVKDWGPMERFTQTLEGVG